jgi:S1-C subfamily serine protease
MQFPRRGPHREDEQANLRSQDGSSGHVRVVRPGSLAVVAIVAALVGATAALGIGKATGWLGDAETVLVPVRTGGGDTERGVNAPSPAGSSAKPLTGNGFDPARIYRARSNGVVTIYAFFGSHPENGTGGTSQGTGFVVSNQGYILTNSHVITTAGEATPTDTAEKADTVYVEFRSGERVSAEVVGFDLFDDVGLVKVDPADHPLDPVPLGDSSTVRVGEPVAAIGSPFGQTTSLSVGVVSATERSIRSLTSTFDLIDAIQIDAPINRGNSGGPLFDARGRVIGINAQIRSNTGNAEGVGFAVPINSAKRSMEELIATGRVRYAWVGVSTQTVTPSMADALGFPVQRGAAVQRVVEDSPAADAGLRGGSNTRDHEGIQIRTGGDVIVGIDGRRVQNAEDVVREVSRLIPGARVVFAIARGTQRLDVPIELGDRPSFVPGEN